MATIDKLVELFRDYRRVVVLTGAGVSTASGIPDYRDESGAWKLSQPMDYREFVADPNSRRRYWARSAIGRTRFRSASPNAAHSALARLESDGRLSLLITQNVDRLHQKAGSRRVIDLHGALDRVICLNCEAKTSRDLIQEYLMRRNPSLDNISSEMAPDGDVQLQGMDFSRIEIPDCESCGGVLKPDVVFYGESVPPTRVNRCFEAIDSADAMLIAGSSLMVYSGYRFVRRAAENGLPIMAINRGVTRADSLLNLKLELDCGPVLTSLVEALGLAHLPGLAPLQAG